MAEEAPPAAAPDPLLAERNTPRFFVENRQIAWVLLIASILWGVYGYLEMPKRMI